MGDLGAAFARAREAREAAEAACWSDCTEEEFDRASEAECEALEALADALVEFAGVALTYDDASAVVVHRWDSLESLMGRVA